MKLCPLPECGEPMHTDKSGMHVFHSHGTDDCPTQGIRVRLFDAIWEKLEVEQSIAHNEGYADGLGALQDKLTWHTGPPLLDAGQRLPGWPNKYIVIHQPQEPGLHFIVEDVYALHDDLGIENWQPSWRWSDCLPPMEPRCPVCKEEMHWREGFYECDVNDDHVLTLVGTRDELRKRYGK